MTDLTSSSDSAVAAYADNYFEYDPATRAVTKQRAQGVGCSACSGGIGEYLFAYAASGNAAGVNAWARQTVETMPEGTTNRVYTNAYAEVMLKATQGHAGIGGAAVGPEWVTYVEHDAAGRVVFKANPSAVETPTGGHAYDDTAPALMPQALVAATGESVVNTTTAGDQGAPAVAVQADGSYLVVWTSGDAAAGTQDVYAQRYSAAGAAVGAEFRVNDYAVSNQNAPAVAALPDGRYVVTYTSWALDGDQYSIGYRLVGFAGSGSPTMTAEAVANATATSWQTGSRVAADATGHFVIGWQSYGQGATYSSIQARRFSYTATAVTAGSEFAVSTGTYAAYITAVAAQPDGRFAVMWGEWASATADSDVLVRAYDTAASPTMSPTVVSQTTADDQLTPSLVFNPAGGYVAAWSSMWQDTYLAGVYARRLDADGAAVGNEVAVNTYTADQQCWPAVAAGPAGGFVVAWMSAGQDGSSAATWGVYGQRFDAAGGKLGGEFRLNATAAGDQMFPAVAADGAGGYVAAWQSDGQDGSGAGVVARRYALDRAGVRDGGGLVEAWDYAAVTTATGDQGVSAGDAAGYLRGSSLRQGEQGVPVPQAAARYVRRTAGDATVYPVGERARFRNADGTGAERTTYAYEWYAGSTRAAATQAIQPTVGTDQNGNATAEALTVWADRLGRPVWTQDAGGVAGYTAYDPVTGAAVQRVADVDTDAVPATVALPDTIYATTGGLHLVTDMAVDLVGRATRVTRPAGDVTYTVYRDAEHEVRAYAGWDPATLTPTGPTVVYREDRGRRYGETITMSAAPATSGGVPTGAEAIAGVQSLSRVLVNEAGQRVYADAYHALPAGGYSATAATLGSAGTTYDRTATAYDDRGRVKWTVTPTGTITRYLYDAMGHPTAAWVGTNDTPTTGFWSPTNTAGANLVQVSSSEYDGGGAGDGTRTTSTAYPHDGTADRVTQTWYDWRDRPVAVKQGAEASETSTVNRPLTYTEYDNLSRAVVRELYDGDGVSVTVTAGVPQRPAGGLLRAKGTTAYDDGGRAYRATTWSVDPASGAVSSVGLTTATWYDARGQAVKVASPGGVVTKTKYDGVGRVITRYTTDGGGDGGWADAQTVTGDVVLEQSETDYDPNGNAIRQTTRQRFHDATVTGALGTATSTTAAKARVSSSGTWYDLANRPVATATVGTNAAVVSGTYVASAWTRPTTIPTRSDAVLVTTTGYDAAGWVRDVTDPRAVTRRTAYDLRGRTVQTVEAYDGGAITDTTNKTTTFTYDGMSHLLTYTAWVSPTAAQTTAYAYGVSAATGSAVASNDLLLYTKYPDKATGAASTSAAERETTAYNALGERTGFTDRNGTSHAYSFDVAGRPTADAATLASGSAVDSAVLRIETAYDSAGQAYLLTSKNATGGVVNQVQREFNGLGQLTKEYQEVTGAVTTTTSPAVQYGYSLMAGGANHSRPTSVTYPGGYAVASSYGTGGGLNDRISRLAWLADAGGHLEEYDYLGHGVVVERRHPEPDVRLTYVGSSATPGVGGDQYAGLDAFGRVVDQRWADGSGTDVDRYGYGYDRANNRTYRENVVAGAASVGLSQVYSYDNLNQLASYHEGTLNGTKTGISGTVAASQTWDADALGNFDSVTTTATGTAVEARTHNQQNQLTVAGGNSIGYDGNGNMLGDGAGRSFSYDPWNRLATATSGTTTTTYRHDALGRRVWEGTRSLYYTAAWQVAEERDCGVVVAWNVWSPVYVDAMVVRDQDTAGVTVGTLGQRLYALQDANWNVTGLVTAAGAAVERYKYVPYGSAVQMSASWVTSTCQYNWKYLYQGGFLDDNSGTYSFRRRNYMAAIMRWLSVDPISYNDGANLYLGYHDNPINWTDSTGECGRRPDIRPRTKKECCDAAMENKTIHQYDAGGIVCCDGTAYACAFPKNDSGAGQPGFDLKIKCIEEHEAVHLSRPRDWTPCAKKIPSLSRSYAQWELNSEEHKNAECTAFRWEVLCLTNQLVVCSSNPQYSLTERTTRLTQVQNRINFLVRFALEEYKCSVARPVPS